ncbi:DctP family TRAP transporter solute-binding subunit [Spiractinospora alimapuensis]|uniref:DctP family TRAP transporter solute-binding subunit n=1 Tax=Spiractinospora alimapuensis TaxID=2820884 RepID=UPI001F26A5D9|nr:DctP family TRAP transporter solute-binding subunit [Spiractinospora alimapuensis]QVQ51423.1 DctP family TRAP transporter solute-binding subunit [Spiractinospora alimapuensis]
MQRKFSKLCTGVAAAATGLSLTACGTAGAASDDTTYSWKMTITVGAASTWYEAAELFAETLERESDGRMSVDVFPNEQLSAGNQAGGVEQLMSGDKDFTYNSTIIYAAVDPRFGAINAPFLYTDYDQADAAISAGAEEAYQELTAEFGVHMLGFGESGFRQVTNNVRPIEAPEDLEGIKIRIPEIGLLTDFYRGSGANPSTMNFAEVFTSLQQGTIEGQENPMDVIDKAGMAEVQAYLTVWNYVYDPLILGVNQELFDSLDPADQDIIQDAADEANAYQIQLNRDAEEVQLEEQAELLDTTVLDEAQMAEFREAVQPLYDDYASVWGTDLIDAVTPED